MNEGSRTTKSVVLRALIGDIIIAILKYVAAFVSLSSSMLAEAIHSTSDSTDQFLLLIGYNLSEKRDRAKFPFGRGREQFFWSFVVAMLVFGISGIMTLVEGYIKLFTVYSIKDPVIVYSVFALSVVVDGYVLSISVAAFASRYKSQGYTNLRSFVEDFRDPTLLTAMVEDLGAIVGVLVALTGVTLSYIFHSTKFDAISAIVIGLIMMMSGLYLAKESKDLLIGEGISPRDQKKIESILKSNTSINKVLDIRSIYQAPESVLLVMDLNFRDGLSTEEIENAIDQIEKDIRDKIPSVSRIYIEAEEIKGNIR